MNTPQTQSRRSIDPVHECAVINPLIDKITLADAMQRRLGQAKALCSNILGLKGEDITKGGWSHDDINLIWLLESQVEEIDALFSEYLEKNRRGE